MGYFDNVIRLFSGTRDYFYHLMDDITGDPSISLCAKIRSDSDHQVTNNLMTVDELIDRGKDYVIGVGERVDDNYQKAIELFCMARDIAQTPRDKARAYTLLGFAAWYYQDFKEKKENDSTANGVAVGEPFFKMAMGIDPTYPLARVFYADLLHRRENFDEAINHMEVAENDLASLYKELDVASFYRNKAKYFLESGQIYLALDEVEKGLAFPEEKSYHEVYQVLGNIYHRIGFFDAAIWAYETACRMDTNYEKCDDAANEFLFVDDTKGTERERIYNGIQRIYNGIPPDDRTDYQNLMLGGIAYQKGDYKIALCYFEKTILDADSNGNMSVLLWGRFMRSWCYIRMGFYDLAIEDLNRVKTLASVYHNLEFSPESVDATIAWIIYSSNKIEQYNISLAQLSKSLSVVKPEVFSNLTNPKSVLDVKGVLNVLDASEVVNMLADTIIYSVMMDKKGDAFLISKILAGYGEYYSWDSGSVEKSGLKDAKARLFFVASKLVEEGEIASEGAAFTDFVYSTAYEIASAALRVFPDDIRLKYLKGRAARRRASSVQNPKIATILFKEAVDLLEDAVATAGSFEKAPERVVIECGLAVSEYAEHLIDHKIGVPETWDHYLNRAEEILYWATIHYSNNPEAWLDWAWNEYYRAKKNGTYPFSITRSRLVNDLIKKMPQAPVDEDEYRRLCAENKTACSHLVTPKQLGDSERQFLWSVTEAAYLHLEGDNDSPDAAIQVMEENDIKGHLAAAEKEVKGMRWEKDLLYAFHRAPYLMGRAIDNNRTVHNARKYEEYLTGSQRVEMQRQNPEANHYFNEAWKYLDMVEPLEQRPGFVDKTRGWIRTRQGRYLEGIEYFRKVLNSPAVSEGIKFDARRGLIEALKNRTMQGDEVGLEEKYNNVLEIAGLALANAQSKRVTDEGEDQDYIKTKLLPEIRVLKKYGLCGLQTKKYHGDVATILYGADQFTNDELKEIIASCREEISK